MQKRNDICITVRKKEIKKKRTEKKAIKTKKQIYFEQFWQGFQFLPFLILF